MQMAVWEIAGRGTRNLEAEAPVKLCVCGGSRAASTCPFNIEGFRSARWAAQIKAAIQKDSGITLEKVESEESDNRNSYLSVEKRLILINHCVSGGSAAQIEAFAKLGGG